LQQRLDHRVATQEVAERLQCVLLAAHAEQPLAGPVAVLASWADNRYSILIHSILNEIYTHLGVSSYLIRTALASGTRAVRIKTGSESFVATTGPSRRPAKSQRAESLGQLRLAFLNAAAGMAMAICQTLFSVGRRS
ncbi:MAG TPA: hypothetical protein PK781_00335, partial [Terrimesophilobacter sp.]|nr:hypothetical protein [Terrimesophilobacter sp.]